MKDVDKTESALPPPAYWVEVHSTSILLPALLGTLFLMAQPKPASLADPIFNHPIVITITAVLWFITWGILITLAYAFAGGFEIRTTALSPTRYYLFIFATGIYPGLVVGAFWLFIRSLLAQLFGLKDLSAMGRLLRVRDIL